MGRTWKDSKFDFKGKKESKKGKPSKDIKKSNKEKFGKIEFDE